jgi:hypothetical protein
MLEEDIGDEKDDEGGTILVGIDTEVDLKSVNSCVGDVHTRPQLVPVQGKFQRSIPVKEGEKVHAADERENVPVNLIDELTLVDVARVKGRYLIVGGETFLLLDILDGGGRHDSCRGKDG